MPQSLQTRFPIDAPAGGARLSVIETHRLVSSRYGTLPQCGIYNPASHVLVLPVLNRPCPRRFTSSFSCSWAYSSRTARSWGPAGESSRLVRPLIPSSDTSGYSPVLSTARRSTSGKSDMARLCPCGVVISLSYVLQATCCTLRLWESQSLF